MSAIFLKILNMSAAASWIAAAVLLLRCCLKRAPKWVNVLLWGFVAVRLLLPFSIESTLSLLPRTEVIRPAVTNVPVQTAAAPAIGTTAAAASGAAASPLSIWTILAWVWLAGAAALLLYGAVSSLCLHRRVREAVRLRGNIYQSERIDSPFVLGTISPKIYLPYRMDSCGWQYVIAHEQAHLRRGDHLWKPLGFLLLTIHWFNPLMWLSYVLLCRDIELACDEKVIQDLECGQRADYMQALVSCSVNRRRIAACPLAFGEIGVKERVKSVMNYKKPTLWVNCSPSQGQNKVTHSASMDICRLSDIGNTRSARALPDPTGIGRCYSSPSSRRLTAAHPQSTSNLESSPPTRPSYVRKSSPAARCPSNFPSATLTAAGYCFSRAE